MAAAAYYNAPVAPEPHPQQASAPGGPGQPQLRAQMSASRLSDVSGQQALPDAFSNYLPQHAPVNPLLNPVVIPQRRLGNKERGFVMAYAPTLEQQGIDEATFLDFIMEANKSLEGSAAVTAVQTAALGISLIPDPSGIASGVATGVRLAAAAYSIIRSTWKTNTFLDKHNENIFLPRGLYCMIVVHNVTEKNVHEVLQQHQLSESPPQPAGASVAGQQSPGTPGWMHNLRAPFHQSARGLPNDVAPLVFYEGDETLDGQSKKKKGFMSSINTYLDQRAQAQYIADNGDDAITKSRGEKPKFKSRYLDPTHPATTGGLPGLLTGGKVTDQGINSIGPKLHKAITGQELPDPTKAAHESLQQSMTPICAAHEQRMEALQQIPDPMLREQGEKAAEEAFRAQLKGIGMGIDAIDQTTRTFKKAHILYLTIINLPSRDEFIAGANSCGQVPGIDTGAGELGGVAQDVVGELGAEIASGGIMAL